MSVPNATYTGDFSAGGWFWNAGGSIGLGSGTVLSTGDTASVVGPNTSDATSTAFDGSGDSDPETLSGFGTQDAAVLEFDFTPDAKEVLLDYVFASDEYNESVRGSGGMADPVAIFVNGDNCATVPGPSGPAPVTINTVNSGNPYGACLVLSLSFWLFFHLRAGGEMETETA